MKFKSTLSKGFTLIELLVVVAIISLLSSVVLASVKEARFKAQQAAYRQYLGEVVKGIELFKSNGGDVSTLNPNSLKYELVTGGVLNEYIKWSAPPSSLYQGDDEITDPPPFIVFSDSGFTCASDSSEYFIYFSSSNTELKFNKVYNNAFNEFVSDAYCVSPERK